MNNSRIKTINRKKPLYYKDIAEYIKNHNQKNNTNKTGNKKYLSKHITTTQKTI